MTRALPLLIVAFLAGARLAADPVDDIRDLLNTGEYLRASGQTDKATRDTPDNQDLHVERIRALLALGRYGEADAAATSALRLVSQSIRVRWAAHDAALAVGKVEQARRYVNEIRQIVTGRPADYRDPADLVVFARMALDIGADAKQVLDQVLATAQKTDPKVRDIYQLKGELALAKHDYALAAKTFQEGLKLFPDETEFHYGLARSFETGDRKQVLAELQAALKINPKHVPSLLLLADHKIDSEEYGDATKILDEVRAVDPWRPEAWAYTAIIAHINNQPATEKTARDTALKYWPTNPLVDWLIGKKLSEKYRFAESAGYERQALKFDENYLPAKTELATDLLRLGEEKEGWDLVEEVSTKDPYDVETFNLMNLRDTMAKYATLKNDDFVLRMTPAEADIYGSRALALLTEARKVLVAKYGIEIARPTYVEVFGDQKDFAVRTFGMPDVAGFLGVCFGRVVTANGAAANVAHPANWESVLWHEFTHVITLQKTQNKMPRWLSEGISVYEEQQRDPTWGMSLTPRYRDFIVKGEITPVSALSSAFLAPPSAEKLQFAYFESAMVVEFIVGKYGIESLKQILNDLGSGEEINRAIAAHTAPIETLDHAFADYAKAKAEALAPKLEFERPDEKLLGRGQEAALVQWAASHENNYYALGMRGQKALADKNWAEAKAIYTHIVELYPAQGGPENAYRGLAAANRGLGDTEAERAALVRLADTSDDAIDAYTRLMEIGQKASDWAAVSRYADKYLAVNPLVIAPHRFLAQSSAALGQAPLAIAENRNMLKLDPPDPTDVHYQLAKLLHASGDPEARRQVVMALEYAPRYQDALNLLREIAASSPAPSPAPAPAASPFNSR